MSNKNHKHELNIAGAWYTTHPDDEDGEGCIACNVCYSGAPEFFAEDENGNAYVKKQPVEEKDIELCKEQMDMCPVGSIGSDG